MQNELSHNYNVTVVQVFWNQSNMAIRNFLVALKLFLNFKSSLSLWSKWQIGHMKWSVIPICSLSNRSLLPSLTVHLNYSQIDFFHLFQADPYLSKFDLYLTLVSRLLRLSKMDSNWVIFKHKPRCSTGNCFQLCAAFTSSALQY